MNKKVFLLLAALFTALFVAPVFGAGDLENSGKGNGSEANSVLEKIRTIWPNGNCAENISGDKRYILVSYACNDDFTAHNRENFLNEILKKGWKLRKESYRIDPNSASYFYKFNIVDQNLYIKLFFRNPLIVWPLHDNLRPKIAIMLNNVKSAGSLEKWANIKLPLSISFSVFENDYAKIAERAKQLNYDQWIFYPGSFNPLSESAADLEKLTLELKKIPEDNFYFTGLMAPLSSKDLKDTQSLRLLYKTMKKNGVRKFLGPATLEVIDTSRILGITSITAVYSLSGEKNESRALAWDKAYGYAQKHGYAVIVLDADDEESMNFLVKTIENTLGFVDYVNLSRLPLPENPSNGK